MVAFEVVKVAVKEPAFPNVWVVVTPEAEPPSLKLHAQLVAPVDPPPSKLQVALPPQLYVNEEVRDGAGGGLEPPSEGSASHGEPATIEPVAALELFSRPQPYLVS
jgi:hypothetical protein